jgi:xanthine dehydrogenase YagR molybdenum-binding subunit
MRAPGEAPGSIALSAIDEMAQACGGMAAFRLKNYAELETISGKLFSSKARECYWQGRAVRLKARPLAPRQMHDGDGLLVGWGMGTRHFRRSCLPRRQAVLRRDGSGAVEIGAHDMGQGVDGAAQIAADGLDSIRSA